MRPYKSLVHKNTATRLLKAKIEFNSKENFFQFNYLLVVENITIE